MTEKPHVCVKEVELALLQKTCTDTNVLVTDLVHLIRGNGTIGLLAEVREQKQMCQRIQAEKKRSEEKANTFWNRYVAPAYNVIIISVLSLLIAGTMAFIQNKNEESRMAKINGIMRELEKFPTSR